MREQLIEHIKCNSTVCSNGTIQTRMLSDEMLKECFKWVDELIYNPKPSKHKVKIETVRNIYYGCFPIYVDYETRKAVFRFDYYERISNHTI